jgi:hypothetical protein
MTGPKIWGRRPDGTSLRRGVGLLGLWGDRPFKQAWILGRSLPQTGMGYWGDRHSSPQSPVFAIKPNQLGITSSLQDLVLPTPPPAASVPQCLPRCQATPAPLPPDTAPSVH